MPRLKQSFRTLSSDLPRSNAAWMTFLMAPIAWVAIDSTTSSRLRPTVRMPSSTLRATSAAACAMYLVNSTSAVPALAAALFGSCFPTTIYIGHPGWKAMGARAGYSVLNALFFTVVCLTGTLAWIAWAVPIDAGMAIVLWIGIVITAQAFQATPREHAPAVVVGLLPGVAAWGALQLKNGLRAAGTGLPGGPPMTEQLIAAFLGSDTWAHGAFARLHSAA